MKSSQTPRVHSLFTAAIAHHQAGRIDQAASAYRDVLRVTPDHADALHLLGLIEAQSGRPGSAVALLQRAAGLQPANAEMRLNLANALLATGQADKALAAYRHAVKLRPDFREARAALLKALDRIASFLFADGRAGDTIVLWQEGIALSPETATHWIGLASALESVVFIKRDPALHDVLFRLLDRPDVNPNRFYYGVLSYLRLIPGFNDALAAAEPPAAIPGGDLFIQLLWTATVAEPEVERTLTRWRAAALCRIAQGEEALSLPLLCAIAAQGFATEFAYVETAEESGTVTRLVAAMADGGDIVPARLAVLACYRPLHCVPGSAALAARQWPAPLDEIIRQQVAEPLEEQRLRPSIPALTDIRDRVSQTVREQYEENPYPRWRNVGYQAPTPSVAERLGTATPDILVAGCGTGQHPAQTAMRFPAARILAVDLSLASLAYARRRMRELGLASVEFAQADLLELRALGRSFDMIESIGVLHHLADPLAGWRVLTDLLKSGGLMFIGLYSELARRPIVAARRFIAERGFDASADGIRAARQTILAEMDDSVTRRLRTNTDFYSLSGCRDLLFHAQEHRFTVPQIAAAIEALGLDFLGFGALDRVTAEKFRQRFPDDLNLRSFANWDEFERDNPDTFPNMYQFWVGKPVATSKG